MKAFLQADACKLPFADLSVDLVFGSPPYADARTYGIGAQRKCQEWIDWMLKVTAEAVRVSRGLVIWICAGVTRKHCYWPGPEGLLYIWWKQGGQCWRPAYWHRVGIPGSGGKQWLRADIEYALCFTGCTASVPWADNTANGHPPKWAPGGEMSYRLAEGQRVNQWGMNIAADGGLTATSNGADGGGDKDAQQKRTLKPSHRLNSMGVHKKGSRERGVNGERQGRRCTSGKVNGDTVNEDGYSPPALANPGCLIKGIKVGGGLMGHQLAHVNEAPFPQKLAEWFVRGWCPPGGTVFDPFSGSGTTVAAAVSLGRHGIGCDLRMSQVELGAKRCDEVQGSLLG